MGLHSRARLLLAALAHVSRDPPVGSSRAGYYDLPLLPLLPLATILFNLYIFFAELLQLNVDINFRENGLCNVMFTIRF